MKKIIIVLLFLSSTAKCQDPLLFEVFPVKENKINYSAVVPVNSLLQTQLFLNASKWFVSYFKSANDVIQLSDKEAGIISGKGIFVTDWNGIPVNVSFTVTLSVKDGKYKYEITGFNYSYYSKTVAREINEPLEYGVTTLKQNNKIFCTQVNNQVEQMIASLNKSMQDKPQDW